LEYKYSKAAWFFCINKKTSSASEYFFLSNNECLISLQNNIKLNETGNENNIVQKMKNHLCKAGYRLSLPVSSWMRSSITA
jgi:hypothetical protein